MKTPLPQADVSLAELRSFYPALAQVAEQTMRNPIDPETAEWLDGPSLLRWLQENGLHLAELGPSMERRFREWRAGEAVSLDLADRVCCRLDHHISEIPAHCWRKAPLRGGQAHSNAAVRESAISRLEAGASIADVAEEVGVTKRTIRNWQARRARS